MNTFPEHGVELFENSTNPDFMVECLRVLPKISIAPAIASIWKATSWCSSMKV